MIEAIVGTQLSSVLLSLVGIGALTCWLFSSFAWGLLCVLPAGLGVLGVFAAMGWAGIPLGVATSMFAATVLCVGDDYAIHLVEALRRLRQTGRSLDDALVSAIAETAPAILIDALAVGAAFGILCFSRVPPNARLGGLVVVSIVVCVVATLGVLPGFVRVAASALASRITKSDPRLQAVGACYGSAAPISGHRIRVTLRSAVRVEGFTPKTSMNARSRCARS